MALYKESRFLKILSFILLTLLSNKTLLLKDSLSKVLPKVFNFFISSLDFFSVRNLEEAKQFVISLVEKGEPNLYHSIMAVLNNKRGATKEEIEKFYFAKYETKRPYLIEKRKLVDEVMELCWKKFH